MANTSLYEIFDVFWPLLLHLQGQEAASYDKIRKKIKTYDARIVPNQFQQKQIAQR